MPKYPEVNFPTILEGHVYAPRLRMESLDGSEMYLTSLDIPDQWEEEHFHLKNFGPIELEGKTWGVSHMQKQSRRGWLKASPDCFHWWYFWRQQLPGHPGTEQGIYFRKPFSWRWDVCGTLGKHWIWTKGFLGGVWD